MMTYILDVNAHSLTIKSDGLQDVAIDLGTDRLTVWQGGSQYLTIAAAGGHWETNAGGGVSDHAGSFETQDGHILVHQV